MFSIVLSHRFANMPPGGIKPGDKTTLLNYCVVKKLSKEFEGYVTKYYPEGQAYEAKAQHSKAAMGPYLILFLKTEMPGAESHPHFWARIVKPIEALRRGVRVSFVPEQYRAARGHEVDIIIRPPDERMVMVSNRN